MALTEQEARVLGAVAAMAGSDSATVAELSQLTGLTEPPVRNALMRLSRTGLVRCTPQGPARWRPTDRGRMAIGRSAYREYVVMR
ncbi:hypothetical protein AB0L82_38690 [Nocardia sp. NPDC052001]|uniref:MarR family transcriptional regulator n=1 Tax=Nocardia sp. NPDC052001 TaxID=3154853 RepID=UPI00341D400B